MGGAALYRFSFSSNKIFVLKLKVFFLANKISYLGTLLNHAERKGHPY